MFKYFFILSLLIYLVFLNIGCTKQNHRLLENNQNQELNLNISKEKAEKTTNISITEDINQKKEGINQEKSEKADLKEDNWLVYENKDFGFKIKYPSHWEIKEYDIDHNNNPIIRLSNEAIEKVLRGEIYIRIEENAHSTTIDKWLNSDDEIKRDKYWSQQKYDEAQKDPESLSASLTGKYYEEEIILKQGQKGLKQIHSMEGGDYIKLLVIYGKKVYVIKGWSESYYFTNEEIRNNIDQGKIFSDFNKVIDSFEFI